MSSAVYVGLLFFCLQKSVEIYCIATTTLAAVGPELAPPRDPIMITLNTKYALSWDWDQSQAESHAITFTTQYVGKYKLESKKMSPNWSTACEEMSHRSCDLTMLGLHYLGIYMLRVRANANGHHSKWVQLEFCPDKDAAVGPPAKVNLAPAGSDLDVFIADPLTSINTSMREHLSKMYYHILYWEHSEDSKALTTQTLSSEANLVTLPGLKARTLYCVSIQSCNDFYNKSSSFTSPQCMQTEGNTPWWQIILYFVASLVIFFLVMLLLLYSLFWCYKTLKATLYPSNQLPIHFQEYLYDSPSSDIPRLLTPVSESELLCDNVIICAEPTVLEIHIFRPDAMAAPPSDLNGRHSRQDSSSSSGDSGVYSTGGTSNLSQLNSSQTCTGTEDLEQVKMQEMTPGLETQLLIADEGIVDMCV
ncbi:interleukin-10 receptor subunit beta isoform X2 [Hippoglossus hippoglossus]|uniref:interleukin-10 receptor subunit beta isoform X2 n=1 Tax=Hippoglossus hippoglossus TaxID=8267 RepID=UPI00148BDADC|nr:interleukin-10 receptor subunit beta isoform X2 [Hippoglossus hippoglossus]XP_035030455.1 interleukin-10 receptor subunit beta isoform X2 [Hippoglossus stenolepis]